MDIYTPTIHTPSTLLLLLTPRKFFHLGDDKRKTWHACLLQICSRHVSSDRDFSQEEQAWEVLVYAGTSCVLSSVSSTPSSCQATLTFPVQAGNPASCSAIDILAESSYFQILRFLYLALTSLCP